LIDGNMPGTGDPPRGGSLQKTENDVRGVFLMFQKPAGVFFASAVRNGIALVLALAVVPGAAVAQVPQSVAVASEQGDKALTLQQAAQQAVLSNPEVLSRWHAIKAAMGERDAAKGGLLPRVDLSAAAGPERRADTPGYTRSSGTLSVSQLLYDGFATRNEVLRLDHATRVRLFEFFDTSETVALEAARAYFDVVRYRELVRLAEENYVEHRAVFGQTEFRVRARVARGVDLEQVSGRLALAEANLLTETANLHDTTARFQRLVGRLPTREMPLPAHLARDLPGDTSSALSRAQQSNAALLAAIENVRASQAALATRSGAFGPRVDLRLRRDQANNVPGLAGNSNATAAEVVLSWNLFAGRSDQARERQFAEQVNVAKDLRDKTCRDTRQILVIAYNDVQKLSEQIEYLQVHEASVDRALTAYRQQFDIGQRTLLDLLDTENELFQARRAVVNARQDLNIAYARTQAGLGNLLRALELAHLETGSEEELARWTSGTDAAQQCPPEPVTVYAVDKQALVARALDRTKSRSLVSARERAALEPAPEASPAKDESADAALKDALEGWRAAWEQRDVAAYLQAYAPGFTPADSGSRAGWQNKRSAVLARAADVSVSISNVTVVLQDPQHATTSFTQDYRSASYRDSVSKTLSWERLDGKWLIVGEITSNSSGK
jgi:adhesin transport system outer membrane protein